MKNYLKRRSKKQGLPPGTMVHVGENQPEKTKVTLLDYDENNNVTERVIDDVNKCGDFKDKVSMTWIDVEGLLDLDTLENLGKQFGLHPLVMEDIVNTDQRPKMEDFGDYVYIVMKMFHLNTTSTEIIPEQVSIVFGNHFVITFQEGIKGDCFDNIRARIRSGKGKITKMSSDYLVYSLIDSIIDTYFTILEQFGDKIESLEIELINNPIKSTLMTIYELKREIIFLRKSVWPLREVIGQMERGESGLIGDATHVYLRDLYDHTINTLDTIETYRDMLSGMLDIYLSSISNRLNEVMKVLTIITTIFIPLSFIAGVYGMNFKDMPELDWSFGYPAVLSLMFVISVIMVIMFKRKKWI
jgi:magnesium transporter